MVQMQLKSIPVLTCNFWLSMINLKFEYFYCEVRWSYRAGVSYEVYQNPIGFHYLHYKFVQHTASKSPRWSCNLFQSCVRDKKWTKYWWGRGLPLHWHAYWNTILPEIPHQHENTSKTILLTTEKKKSLVLINIYFMKEKFKQLGSL